MDLRHRDYSRFFLGVVWPGVAVEERPLWPRKGFEFGFSLGPKDRRDIPFVFEATGGKCFHSHFALSGSEKDYTSKCFDLSLPRLHGTRR